eukprot:2139249-Prymnesium_polylepis.1
MRCRRRASTQSLARGSRCQGARRLPRWEAPACSAAPASPGCSPRRYPRRCLRPTASASSARLLFCWSI